MSNNTAASLSAYISANSRRKDTPHTHTAFDRSPRTLSLTDGGQQLREKLFKHALGATNQELQHGPNSLTERVTGMKFRLFLDLDFSVDSVKEFLKIVTQDQLTDELKSVTSTVYNFVSEATGDQTEMYIATRLPYKLHLHFPNIVVTVTEAKRVCEQVRKRISESPLYNDQTVDTSVYTTGLRMLWCHKGTMTKPRKEKQERDGHEALFGTGSWSAVYEITDCESWTKKSERTLDDLEVTSVHVDQDADLTPLVFKQEELPLVVLGVDKREEDAAEAEGGTKRRLVLPERAFTSDLFKRSRLNEPLLQRRNPLADWTQVVPYLTGMGFEQLALVSKTEEGYNFDAGRTKNCPLCKTNCHESNHWYCIQIMPEMLYVKNYSVKCRSEIVTMEKISLIHDIMKCPNADADYGKLFARIYKGVMFWTRDGRFVGFQKNKWVEVSTEEVRDCCRETLLGVLNRMAVYVNEHKLWMEVNDFDKAAISSAKTDYANLLVAIRYVKTQRHLKDILECSRDYLYNRDFEKLLDANVFLLGTDNGVIDLKTCSFRSATPDDLVSKSVEYSFLQPEDEDPDIKAQFATFIQQIYPVEAEREIIQRYLGYCLLGDHREKVVLLLTDKRKGYNGKSTMAKMMMQGMGPEYMRRGGNGLLYKSDTRHETVNSHDAGLIAYLGYRVAYFEELDPKERFNNQEVKDKNGGNAHVQGRRVHSTVQEKFIWGTKMVLLFNDNNFPQFDFTDPQLIERLLIVHHRSRFYGDPLEYEKHKHEPYTYPATDIDQHMTAWRPYYLIWALEGLRNYWTRRFSVVPLECKIWKDGLVNDQDRVRECLGKYTIDGPDDGSDMVWTTGSELYELFKQDNSAEKREKDKDRLGSRKFMSRVAEIWRIEPIAQKKIRGHNYRTVFLGKQIAKDLEMDNC